MRTRALAIAAVCAGLWGGGSAHAQESSPTPTPTPEAQRNTSEGEGTLPQATPEPTPVRSHRRRARRPRHRGRTKPEAAPPAALSPAPAALPDVSLDRFRIPPFLLPIYRAAGLQYGVRWEVLAAINEIETDYGRNLAVSSAGAVGWMQFMPASWRRFGVDANADGVSDPYDPADAIFAAARYLRAAGSDRDLPGAVYAYNHADWYVDSVLERARLIGGLPSSLVGPLAGLAEGRFPVYSRATYGRDRAGDPSSIAPRPRRRAVRIVARRGAAAIAVNDGRIVRLGSDGDQGRFIELRDAFGNTFRYSHLATLAATYPALRPVRRRAGGRPTLGDRLRRRRLFAHPARPNARAAGGARQLAESAPLPRLAGRPPLAREDYVARTLTGGARVSAGTVLGRVGRTPDGAVPHVRFEIQPAGLGTAPVDPVPILDGWRLLESTAGLLVAGDDPRLGQISLLGRQALERRVLSDPRIDVYECGRRDIRSGAINRRVLATLEILAESGLEPTVSSLRCGHSLHTSSGKVSQHSSGNAVDIAAVNGVPIYGHQGPGSITEVAIRRLQALQGALEPDQIISLMRIDGAANTLALADHDDHIHVGWRPEALAARLVSRPRSH